METKQKAKLRYTLKHRYFFNSPFEERKALSYLNNLINSTFLLHKTADLFNLTVTLMGHKSVMGILKKVCPEFLASDDFAHWAKNEDVKSITIAPKTLRTLLRRDISSLISKKINALSAAPETALERRLKIVQSSFRLHDVEIKMLLFQFLRAAVLSLNNAFSGDRHDIADFGSNSRFRNYGHLPLGLNKAAFLQRYAAGNVFKANIFEISNSICISSWCMDYLSGVGDENLSLDFFTKQNDEPLLVDDFEVSPDELSVLDTVIKSREGRNILFYGTPGVGKTSFARSLAKKYHKELLSVKVPQSDVHRDRLQAIYATVNLADKNKSIVLVDEADEILNTYNSVLFKSVTKKSWINTFLDTHGKKIIWITNRSDQIDPSTMRRFGFSLEFKKFDPLKRMKVLKYELEKRGIEKKYFSEDELKDLCQSHAVDAGGIVNAVRTVAINKNIKKDAAIRNIKTILKNHERATSGRKTAGIRERTFHTYTIQGLNASCDLSEIVSSLNQHADDKNVKMPCTVSLLLYGMPGTGKTEFVYYLGHSLKKDVILKRASEIQSKWVGETEKNIAGAFAEAGENGAILLFDEADSFLFPRKDAMQSWEKSHTNEILTQLENFKGIVVFATNDIDGLDHAALRRFRFKVRFDPLTPEGNVHFYNSLLKPLLTVHQAMSEDEVNRLKGISGLTPGDIAVVKDQYEFFQNSEISHDLLIKALTNEAIHKRRMGLPIGF